MAVDFFPGTIVHVKSEKEFDFLVNYLESNGHTWETGKPRYDKDLCIRIDDKCLNYASRHFYERKEGKTVITLDDYMKASKIPNMVIKVDSRSEYNALMEDLEQRGYKWSSRCRPTELDIFFDPFVYIVIKDQMLMWDSPQSFYKNNAIISYQEYLAKYVKKAEPERYLNLRLIEAIRRIAGQ